MDIEKPSCKVLYSLIGYKLFEKTPEEVLSFVNEDDFSKQAVGFGLGQDLLNGDVLSTNVVCKDRYHLNRI